jgi:2-polyprenyl-3-methyl-5-hydroxy-6-metoxy-1,4-benzoquinol methylase
MADCNKIEGIEMAIAPKKTHLPEDLFPYEFETPWPQPTIEECSFYHFLDFPDGESVSGVWDIRDNFANYIGGYNVNGKTLLDVGTASGFLAFEAEKAGAIVTATDAYAVTEWDRLPFKQSLHHRERGAWAKQSDNGFVMMKNGFWYSWHKNRSDVKVIYAPLERLPYCDQKFDVVLAGAIFEHLANPIGALGNLAGMAKEAFIIAFTVVADTDAQVLETANDWSNPAESHSFTWWTASRGLYNRVLDNLGFDVTYVNATAKFNGVDVERPTIIARRR